MSSRASRTAGTSVRASRATARHIPVATDESAENEGDHAPLQPTGGSDGGESTVDHEPAYTTAPAVAPTARGCAGYLYIASFCLAWFLTALVLYGTQHMWQDNIVSLAARPLYELLRAWPAFYVMGSVMVTLPFCTWIVWALWTRPSRVLDIALFLTLAIGTGISLLFPGDVDDPLQPEPLPVQLLLGFTPRGTGGLVATRPVMGMLVVDAWIRYVRLAHTPSGRHCTRGTVYACMAYTWVAFALGFSVATNQLAAHVAVVSILAKMGLHWMAMVIYQSYASKRPATTDPTPTNGQGPEAARVPVDVDSVDAALFAMPTVADHRCVTLPCGVCTPHATQPPLGDDERTQLLLLHTAAPP